MIAAAVFALIAYLVGNRIFADYLQLHYVAGTGELAVFASALIGAALGFLWFNAPPAAVFMGDTGSLSLGGALGALYSGYSWNALGAAWTFSIASLAAFAAAVIIATRMQEDRP